MWPRPSFVGTVAARGSRARGLSSPRKGVGTALPRVSQQSRCSEKPSRGLSPEGLRPHRVLCWACGLVCPRGLQRAAVGACVCLVDTGRHNYAPLPPPTVGPTHGCPASSFSGHTWVSGASKKRPQEPCLFPIIEGPPPTVRGCALPHDARPSILRHVHWLRCMRPSSPRDVRGRRLTGGGTGSWDTGWDRPPG